MAWGSTSYPKEGVTLGRGLIARRIAEERCRGVESGEERRRCVERVVQRLLRW